MQLHGNFVQGGFLAAKEVLHLVSDEARLDILRQVSMPCKFQVVRILILLFQAHVQLEHPESRVRLAIADLLREMARLQGTTNGSLPKAYLLTIFQNRCSGV